MKEAIKSKQVLLKNNSYLKVMLLLFNITFNILVLFTAVLIKDMSFEQWLFSFALLSLVQLLVNIITVSLSCIFNIWNVYGIIQKENI